MSDFCDIYILNNTFNFVNNKLPSFKSDLSNLLIKYNTNDLSSKDNILKCESCESFTSYVYDISIGKTYKYICPQCYYNTNPTRRCNKCYKKYGCDSCGGSSNIMVNIIEEDRELLLCAQDRCLNCFNYRVNLEDNMICTCDFDNLLSIYEKIDPYNYQTLSVILNPKKNSINCLLCNKNKYKQINTDQICRGKTYSCQCIRE